jgi:hypothetical protein
MLASHHTLRFRAAIGALLLVLLCAGYATSQPRCWACASGCRMTTRAEFYDPNNLECGCPSFSYCAFSPICVDCYYGSTIYRVSGNCQTYYQGTYDSFCGCAEGWLARSSSAGASLKGE